jgi:phosphoribosylformylglycinamidine synthase
MWHAAAERVENREPAHARIEHSNGGAGWLWNRHRRGKKHVPGRSREIIEVSMKARVFVSLKSTVLDPQGQTVCSALHSLGHPGIADVRQGKFFDIVIGAGMTREQAQTDIDAIARDVLANPVIEDFRVEFLD